MLQVLYVGIGGFIGACLRYGLALYSPLVFGSKMPYGTLIANVTGGILIGLVMKLSTTGNLIPADLRLFLATGLLGGFTTFSAFSYETISLLDDGNYFSGLMNIGLNLFLSLAGVILGRFIAQMIV